MTGHRFAFGSRMVNGNPHPRRSAEASFQDNLEPGHKVRLRSDEPWYVLVGGMWERIDSPSEWLRRHQYGA